MASKFLTGLEGLLSGSSPIGNFGLGLLSASGPSPYPVSTGQAIASASQFASQRQLEAMRNQAMREQILEKKRRNDATQQLVGLLGAPERVPAGQPLPPGGGVLATRDMLQPRLPGLLAQANPEAFTELMAKGLLSPQTGAQNSASPIGKLYDDLESAQIAGDKPRAEAIQSMITRELGSRADFNQVVTVRNDVISNSKPFLEAQQGFNRVQVGAKSATPAGDLALIFGYMKTLDPTSTVREGEAASVQNAGNIPDRIVGIYNRVVNGERLSPEQRQDFLAQGQAQFGKIVEQQKRVIADAGKFAERHGLAVDDLVPSYLVPQFDFSNATGRSAGDSSDPFRVNQLGGVVNDVVSGIRRLAGGARKAADLTDAEIRRGLGLPSQ